MAFLELHFELFNSLLYIFVVSFLSRRGRVLGVQEHVVEAGSDVQLPCQVEGSEDQVVVWRLAGPGHQDRILSVGKMLVRNDGKGNAIRKNCDNWSKCALMRIAAPFFILVEN